MGTTSKHLSRQPRPRDALSTKASAQWVTILDAPRTIWQSKLGTTFPLSMSRDWNVKLCSSEIVLPIFWWWTGVASKFRYGSARADPDVWMGLDHLRFRMDRGYGSACGFRVWIGLYILTRSCELPICGWTHPIVSWTCSVLIKAQLSG